MERLLNSIFDSVSDAVFILNSKGFVLESNPAACRIYGREQEEFYGMSAKNLFAPADSYKFVVSLRKALSAGKRLRYDGLHKNKQGRTLRVSVQVRPWQTADAVRAVMIIKDNTGERRLKGELEDARVEAEAGMMAKSQFLANINHEVRTPMNMIMGYARLLKMDCLGPEEVQELADSVLSNSEILMRQLETMLDLSQVDKGSLNLNPKTFALYPEVKKVIRRMEPHLESKGSSIALDFKPDVSARVRCDPERFKQVLSNLAQNAIKFSDGGEIIIQIFYDAGDKLIFRISDQGIGIPEREWKRLFNPFTQADETASRERGGSGLGLAVSKQVARAMGGDVVLKTSALGKGSVFEFSLGSGANLWNERQGKKQDRTKRYRNLEKAKILLVEDVKENQALIKLYLKDVDCRLRIAEDGKQALDMLGKESFDLVLMDLQMPRMDGFDATWLMRQKGLKVPVIALTASAMQEDKEKCSRYGFNGHLAKPVRSTQLLSAVNGALKA